ncbi:hypothetical protein KM043_005362 [Ampulex compressa]|nr:hypothetical protein KM043_005362 [Ampulex compressa]
MRVRRKGRNRVKVAATRKKEDLPVLWERKYVWVGLTISFHPLRHYITVLAEHSRIAPGQYCVFLQFRVPHAGNHGLFPSRPAIKAAEKFAISGFDQNAGWDIRVEICGLPCAGNTVSCLSARSVEGRRRGKKRAGLAFGGSR